MDILNPKLISTVDLKSLDEDLRICLPEPRYFNPDLPLKSMWNFKLTFAKRAGIRLDGRLQGAFVVEDWKVYAYKIKIINIPKDVEKNRLQVYCGDVTFSCKGLPDREMAVFYTPRQVGSHSHSLKHFPMI